VSLDSLVELSSRLDQRH